MRHLRILEKQVAWKREGGFNRIKNIAEIHGHTLRRLNAGFDSESLYTGWYNPRWPLIPEEFTKDMNVQVGSLRACAATTAAAIWFTAATVAYGRYGLDEPGVTHTVTKQTEQEGNVPIQANVDFFCALTLQRFRSSGKIYHPKQTSGKPRRSNYSTSHRLPGVCATAEEPAGAKGDSTGFRANQAV